MIDTTRFNQILRRLKTIGRYRTRNFVNKLRRVTALRLIARTVQEMSDDDATHMAAAISYYALISLFPLILGLIAIASFLIDDAATHKQITEWVTSFLPGSEEFVNQQIESLLNLRGTIGAFAIVSLLWSGSAVFGGITRSINRAWDVHQDRPLHISKARQLLMALLTGFLFLSSTTLTTFLRAYERFATEDFPFASMFLDTNSVAILQASSFALVFAVFLLLYKYVPNTKTYWQYIWVGALVAAVLFEITKNLFIVYLHSFANFKSLYGALAPVIALMFWTYLSGLILILGAELSSEYGRIKRGGARGVLLH